MINGGQYIKENVIHLHWALN